MHELSLRQKEKEEDADMNLAQTIVQNKQYGRADDEYDFDDGRNPKRDKKKVGVQEQLNKKNGIASRILTQQERCQFCFENPTRPKHLVVSIANFAYLMLPQWQPVVQGHCCILPMQVSFTPIFHCFLFSFDFRITEVGSTNNICFLVFIVFLIEP